MLSRLLRALRQPSPDIDGGSPANRGEIRALREELVSLDRRLQAVEHFTNLLHDRELTRTAEHHAMLDRLDRLYKRLVSRMAYAEGEATREASEESIESVASLKKRLGR